MEREGVGLIDLAPGRWIMVYSSKESMMCLPGFIVDEGKNLVGGRP